MADNFPDQKHLFSFYSPGLIQSSWALGAVLWIEQEDLIHRLIKVVKVNPEDRFVIFDKNKNINVVVLQVLKKSIQVKLLSVEENRLFSSKIRFLIPLLKKEALEQSIYSLCELGVNDIQLVITQKSRQSLLSPAKEIERLRGIVIAAAEQSKNYSLSVVYEPQKLSEAVMELPSESRKIVFDVDGKSVLDLLLNQDSSLKNWILIVGPEGGLTRDEMILLGQKDFTSCALTQTTLRAVQAVSTGAALFRLS